MSKTSLLTMLLLTLFATTGSPQERLNITFKNGSVQSFDINSIQKIEFGRAQHADACWTGRFTGQDISGYQLEINLTETDGRVEGGYKYHHVAQQKDVTAVITDAVIQGNVLEGRWQQTKGIAGAGTFRWQWLPNEKCRSFEGSFDGTKFWYKMSKQ